MIVLGLLPTAFAMFVYVWLIQRSGPVFVSFTTYLSPLWATGLGVLLALSWPVGLGAASVFLLVLAVVRIVSLASMLAAVTAALLVCLLPEPLPYRLLVIAGGLYVIVLHRANVARLLAGTEPKIGRRA